MDAKKREIRTIDCELSVREAEGGQTGESRTITGRAIVFNVESVVIDDWGERFREVILPECVTMEFLNTQDVKMNMLHDRHLTLARNNKAAANATLRMAVDEQGVTFEFEAPKCDIGDRCLEMVRRGDYSGCSFEFMPKDYEVERTKNADGTEDVIIRHKSFEWLGALTIGLDPAYVQTSVNAREIGTDKVAEPAPEPEPKPAEPTEEELKAKAEAEAKERERLAAQRKREIAKRKIDEERIKFEFYV